MNNQEKKRLAKKRLDKLLTPAAKVRYGHKCVMCGSENGLAAHHWVHTKGASGKWRWELDNLALLCYPCHIHKIHQHGSITVLKELERRMRSWISEDRQVYIENHNEPYKFSLEDMLEIERNLKGVIENGDTEYTHYTFFPS